MSTLSNRLKSEREKRGWSQVFVANKLGMKRSSTYANWEYGIREPDTEMLNKMAELYEVTIDYLVGRSDIGSEDKNKKGSTPLLDEDETTAILKEIAAKYDIDVTDPVKKRKLEEVIKLVFDYRMDGNEL